MSFLLAVAIAVSSSPQKASQGLISAARQGQVAALEALIAGGADPNGSDGAGTTPLMAAAAAGQTAVLTALADAGADLDARDRLGRTALDLALAGGNPDAVRVLRRRARARLGQVAR